MILYVSVHITQMYLLLRPNSRREKHIFPQTISLSNQLLTNRITAVPMHVIAAWLQNPFRVTVFFLNFVLV